MTRIGWLFATVYAAGFSLTGGVVLTELQLACEAAQAKREFVYCGGSSDAGSAAVAAAFWPATWAVKGGVWVVSPLLRASGND